MKRQIPRANESTAPLQRLKDAHSRIAVATAEPIPDDPDDGAADLSSLEEDVCSADEVPSPPSLAQLASSRVRPLPQGDAQLVVSEWETHPKLACVPDSFHAADIPQHPFAPGGLFASAQLSPCHTRSQHRRYLGRQEDVARLAGGDDHVRRVSPVRERNSATRADISPISTELADCNAASPSAVMEDTLNTPQPLPLALEVMTSSTCTTSSTSHNTVSSSCPSCHAVEASTQMDSPLAQPLPTPARCDSPVERRVNVVEVISALPTRPESVQASASGTRSLCAEAPVLSCSQVSPAVSRNVATPERWRHVKAHTVDISGVLSSSRSSSTAKRRAATDAVHQRSLQVRAYVIQNLVPDLSDVVPGVPLTTAALAQRATTSLTQRPRLSPGVSKNRSVCGSRENESCCDAVRCSGDAPPGCAALAGPTLVSFASDERPNGDMLSSEEVHSSKAAVSTATEAAAAGVMVPPASKPLLKEAGRGAVRVAKGVMPLATLSLLSSKVGAPRTAEAHRRALALSPGAVRSAPEAAESVSSEAQPHASATRENHTRQMFFLVPRSTTAGASPREDTATTTASSVFSPRSPQYNSTTLYLDEQNLDMLPFSAAVDMSSGDPVHEVDFQRRALRAAKRVQGMRSGRDTLLYNLLPHPKERARANPAFRKAEASTQAALYVWSGRATTHITDTGSSILPEGFAPVRRQGVPRRPRKAFVDAKQRSREHAYAARRTSPVLPADQNRRTGLGGDDTHVGTNGTPSAAVIGLHALSDSTSPYPPLRAIEVCRPPPDRPASTAVEAILGEDVYEQRRERVTHHAVWSVAHACSTTTPLRVAEGCASSALEPAVCATEPSVPTVMEAADPTAAAAVSLHVCEPRQLTEHRFYYDEPPRPSVFATEEVLPVHHSYYTTEEHLVRAHSEPSTVNGCDSVSDLVYARRTYTHPQPQPVRAYEWAAAHPTTDAAVAREWHASLCTIQCGPSAESLLCQSCQLSRQCNTLNYSHPRVLWPLCLMMFCLDPCTCTRCSSCVACLNRSTIRARYGISGSFLEDGAVACCCTPCATQQNLLEMRYHGHCPGGLCFLPLVEPPATSAAMI